MFDYDKILAECITYFGDFANDVEVDYLVWELRERYPNLSSIDDIDIEEFIGLCEFCKL